MILGIETATPVCSVAIGSENGIIASITSHEDQSHSRLLTDQIQKVLTQSETKKKDLRAIAVSLGPGSYTGLRIGLSAAKGMCYALDIPLIGISTLKSMALNAKQQLFVSESALLIPMIDARRNEVFTAVYNEDVDEIEKPHAHIFDNQSFLKYLKRNKVYAFGTGAKKAKQFEFSDQMIVKEEVSNSANSLIPLAMDKFNSARFDSLAYTEPFYLKEHFTTNS